MSESDCKEVLDSKNRDQMDQNQKQEDLEESAQCEFGQVFIVFHFMPSLFEVNQIGFR